MAAKRKSPITWILLGFVLLGLGGFGVTNFAGGRNPALATVGGVEVTADEYARGLRSELDAFAAQTGRRPTAEEAAALGISQSVQARLITAAALEAEARDLGLSAGDAAVAEQLTRATAFQGPNGQFDRARYGEVLRREGLTESGFENDLRMDSARLILQRAVVGGVVAPPAQVARTAAWITERRDLHWRELTAADLPEPVTAPDEDTLKAWHEANAAQFTAPETRSITYAWLTPEMLVDEVELDEDALRAAYAEHLDEFQKPARRLVERLAYPDAATAEAAKARLDSGEANFEQLAAERGLQLADIDLGEVTEAALGDAGPAVFAAAQNGIVGPLETELGPALFAVNAILDPVDIPFEAAREELRTEAALDRAQRLLDEKAANLADLLAGGATLEQLADEGGMKLGQIDWQAEARPEAGSIAAYPAFREAAAELDQNDFPELQTFDEGGIFALRLDKLTPPALIPFDEARPMVLADWTDAETRRRLAALAEEQRLADQIGGTAATDLGRDSVIDGVPPAVVSAGFALAEPGDSAVAEADERIFIVALDRIQPGDTTAADHGQLEAAIERGLSESLAIDVFDAYARALQQIHGLRLDPQVAAAVNARIQ